MNPIDFILNVAALMLWMRSRSIMQDRSRSRSGTLLSTLVKTGSRNPAGWIFLGGLVLLLAHFIQN
jgi:hypothetical protein